MASRDNGEGSDVSPATSDTEESVKSPVRETQVASGRGKGRGRGRGRPRGRGKHVPPEQDSCQTGKGKGKVKKRGIPKIQCHVKQEDEPEEHTSASEETRRIARAEKDWISQTTKPAKFCLDSETETETVKTAEDTCTRPKTSSVTDFTEWLIDNVLTDDEKQLLVSRDFKDFCSIGEFCAGMASGTICMHTIQKLLEYKLNKKPWMQTVLVSECVKWKQDVCRRVCEGCGDDATFVDRTEDACALSHVMVDFAISAIECDDISTMTVTPRGVTDEGGRSGKSFLEYVKWLDSHDFKERPSVLLIECVANLMRMRKTVSEKGTSVVSDFLTERGYSGTWRILNTKNFNLPQSRSRVFGLFCKVNGFGPKGIKAATAKVNAMWQFVQRCQLQVPEPLHRLVHEHATFGDDESSAKKQRVAKQKIPKKDPKWVSENDKFRKKHGIMSNDDLHPLACEVLRQSSKFNLTDREANVGALQLTLAIKQSEGKGTCYVGNIGDSIRYCRFSRSLHPCLLPKKKYLICNLPDGMVGTNSNAQFWYSLQGLSCTEVRHAGLDRLTASQAQELCGNSFSANVVVSIMMAVLLNV